MNRINRLAALFLCLSAIFTLASCERSDPAPQSKVYFEYFDTVSTFYDYSGLSESDFNALSAEFKEELRTYHELYDIYNEYDGIANIATVNRLAGKGAVRVDKKIIDMLLFSKELYTRTSGEVNVALGAVLEIWHDYRTAGKELPPYELLAAAAEHTDINALIIDEVNMTVELLDPEMSLDVGAIAKGYAVEMIATTLAARGHTSFVIDVGGNLRTVGAKPSGAGWSAGVRNPDAASSQSYVYKTELKNNAMVTSGSYQRYYTVGGKNYHHIINGETLMPENYYLSVTVISDSSALSDALSTAIFNMEYEEAEDFVAGFSGITVVAVMPDGAVTVLP